MFNSINIKIIKKLLIVQKLLLVKLKIVHIFRLLQKIKILLLLQKVQIKNSKYNTDITKSKDII